MSHMVSYIASVNLAPFLSKHHLQTDEIKVNSEMAYGTMQNYLQFVDACTSDKLTVVELDTP